MTKRTFINRKVLRGICSTAKHSECPDVRPFTKFHIPVLWVIKMRVVFIPLQLTDARMSFMFLLKPNFYYFS